MVRTTCSVRSTYYLLLLKPTVERRILYLLLMDTKISTVVFYCVTENSDDTFWKALGSIRDDLHSITLTSFLPLSVCELRKTPHGALCRCVFGSTDNVKNAKPNRLVNRNFLQQADVQPHPGQLRRNAPHREMPIAMEMIVESTMDV